MSIIQRTQLKTGQRPVQVNIRSFKPGEILFEEGTKGREVFIIQEGKVGVYKVTPDGETELAQIEKGGIVGEMSLLDNLPRSATVRAVEPTTALLISEMVFQSNLAKAPVWLASIIKIVVSRLRDANRRVDQTALRDRELGIVSLMSLLLTKNKYQASSRDALSYDLVIAEAYYVCRLKKKETLKVLGDMEKRGLIEIIEDTEHKRHICLADTEAFKLYLEYLNLRSEQKKFREADISDEAVAVLGNIAYVAQKSGQETPDGVSLAKSALLEDLSDKKPEHLEKILMDLRRKGLADLLPQEKDTLIIIKPEILSRIKKIKEWLPRFESSLS
jgi:CRP-like cAMP-binding protein